MEGHERSVFGWLDCIRARPEMYLRNNSLRDLETLIWGYYSGLGVHGIVEDVPHMNRHFLSWFYYRTKWSCCSLGWAAAIDQRHPDSSKSLATFFGFVDEYRKLRLTGICTVQLTKDHNPTGKRVCIGLDGRMEKPQRVDVIRYRPAPLHFLRFHYEDRIEDWDLLMTGSGEHATTVHYAKRWAHDELQVSLKSWTPMAKGR